ncbi:MAG TPA: hypothetical protein VGR72_05250 [Candidatus Acidoferrales bacterium]|nr:hypothetical protein [Candidatus Acidoferrales bacterium]
MANVLPMEKQVAAISALAEGSGIRRIERITGIHRDTIMWLGVRDGSGNRAGLLDSRRFGEGGCVTYIEELRDVIRKLHGVETKHVESIPVKEIFQGKTVWEGVVEVIELMGHPKAPRAYAWAHDTDDPMQTRKHVTVLHIPPVTSAVEAVRAAIVQEFRNREAEA